MCFEESHFCAAMLDGCGQEFPERSVGRWRRPHGKAMSWRKKVNPGKEKKKRDARKKEFALVLARIRDNDPSLKAASLRQLGLVEADAEELHDALKGNTVLRSLDISRNHLRDGGAV